MAVYSRHRFARPGFENEERLLAREGQPDRGGAAPHPFAIGRSQHRNDSRRMRQNPGRRHLFNRRAAQFPSDLAERPPHPPRLFVLFFQQPADVQGRPRHRGNADIERACAGGCGAPAFAADWSSDGFLDIGVFAHRSSARFLDFKVIQ